jgi:hypothetical protein
MRIQKMLFLLLVGGLLFCGAVVRAQPNLGGGQGANPPAQLPPGINLQDWQKMTPEQRREAVLRAVEQTLRGGLDWMNVRDKPTQDAIVTFALEQEKALEPVREKHRKVAQALLNNAVTEQQVGALMEELLVAEAEAREKRDAAVMALDKQIGFSKKPRLAAFLSLAGLTGEQTGFIGGVLGNIMGSIANVAANAPPQIPAGPPAVNNQN